VNVGFAALTMNRDLGLTATAFGWGSGLFFVSYFFLEIPSNLAMQRFGARRWLARIMITWGVVSVGAAFVQGPVSFYISRFVLGAAEAGFFPGSVFYLMYWFPPGYRSRMTAIFMTAIPISSLIGAPVSTALLSLGTGGGLHGWQWLFIVEGGPAILLGISVMLFLPDSPREASWLTEAEKTALLASLEVEKRGGRHLTGIRSALVDGKVWLLAIVQMGLTVSAWLPQIVAAHGVGVGAVGWLLTIPYAAATVGMIFWGGIADRGNSRVVHLIVACLLGGGGLLLAACTSDLTVQLIGVTISTVGNIAARPIFWPVPTAFLSGSAAAVGISLINSVGNLGGFIGPFLTGWLKDETGSYAGGLGTMSAALFIAAGASALVGVAMRRAVRVGGTDSSATKQS